MKKNKTLLYVYSFTIFLLASADVKAQEKDDGFSLRKLFGLDSNPDTVFVNKHFDFSTLQEWKAETGEFYRHRSYTTAWFEDDEMNQNGQELLAELKNSWKNGLPEPIGYLSQIELAMINMKKLFSMPGSKTEAVTKADVLMTQAYFEYASNLYSGLLNPVQLNVIWEILPEKIDLVNHLKNALEREKVAASLKQLEPKHEQYTMLLSAFKKLAGKRLNGGWPMPGYIPAHKENDVHANVIRLKKYLLATGDLQTNDSAYIHSPHFDNQLTQAVKIFQHRHGLKEDGIPGETTLEQMNVPVDYRLAQFRLNIDRVRWLPHDFGQKHIVINIPDYSFKYMIDNQVKQQMNVVVGQNENYTPVLEDTLYSIIFNPSWNVPNSIATKEIFPKMLEDTTYLQRNKYTILRESYVSSDTIDIIGYNWSEVSRDSFPYFIVQHPGPFNSLGQVQFMLQNQYSIFLHDTPADNLFDVAQRDFSHGCIRLEKPGELALTLLEEQLPADTLMKYMMTDKKQVVYLDEKIPVHIIYQTAWVDETNQIHFRKDVYGFDKISMSLLRKSFPEETNIKIAEK